jgi:16S rRNA (cytosine967-C5)-methyltransferase
MRFDNLLRYALRILNAYTGETPLHNWLKSFFRENPQMGSRDRKQVSEMVYCYFRLGHSLKNIPSENRILIGLFLSNQVKEQILQHLNPEWHLLSENSITEKIEIVQQTFPQFDPLQIFPWANLLSSGISHKAYCLSFLEKPRLFIRARPGQDSIISGKLLKHKIGFLDPDPYSVLPFKSYSFANAIKLDDIIVINKEAVVQDLSSQNTARFLNHNEEGDVDVWDCCTGSGGKSILLKDLYPGFKLTVSDIRESILRNCALRFKEAGIQPELLFKADLTNLNDMPVQSFDFIVADLPCTGSGTWSRNPEALYFFKPEFISVYYQRQQKILANVISRLKPGATLVYITCSVFEEENEMISSYLLNTGYLKLEQQEMISGYVQKADSMFVSRFSKTR